MPAELTLRISEKVKTLHLPIDREGHASLIGAKEACSEPGNLTETNSHVTTV